MRRIVATLLLALLPLLAAAQEGAAKDRVSIVLNWFPEAEHGGYYAALVHGYYAEAGLDVEILPGGVDVPVLPMVATGRVQFGVDNADQLLLARTQQAPVVAVMAPMQVSPRCILVHESSGIQSFEQLENMTLGMSAKAAFSEWLLKRYPLAKVKIVPYPGNVSQFLVDKNYGCQGYNISEPIVARRQGATPRVLMVSDTGYNPYTSLLITSEKLAAEKPDVVRRMTEASIKGWRKYIEDPARTNAFINKLNPQMEMYILDEGAKLLVDMVLDEAAKRDGLGSMTAERWSTLVSQLEEIGLLKPGSVPAESAYTTEFLPAAK
ncbi:MAG: ABC transporter substrate-binding protein [Candidatus Sumerlaeia bacterium]|nr:ABC transporter substrate-binding protein [Candidatus Sumerlaeia bacterium]